VTPILEAASVILTRRGGSSAYFIGRSPQLRFLGGFHAFPGGKVHPDDACLADPTRGLTVRHVAAIRELFEETGVLLAHRADGPLLSSPAPKEWRLAVLEEHQTFAELLQERGLHLEASDLLPVGSLVTPAFTATRFDTTFYVAELPNGQEPEILPGELTSGAWLSADDALTAWERGEWLLSPPTVSLIQSIRTQPVSELPERFRPTLELIARQPVPPIWFSPAVRMIPLFCDGLPPTTHTNVYCIGNGPAYLLDPGPADPAEQQILFDILDSGPRLSAVVLTHHHRDHVGAAMVCAERYGVPILAHADAAHALKGKVRVDRFLNEGDRLDLGISPRGEPWHLEALLTTGHAPGHLAFYEATYQLLFVGDMISTVSSVIVAPPEGDLVAYLASLYGLREYPARLLLPAHGSPSARPTAVIDEALAHRAKREGQILAALAEGPRELAELAETLYRGLSGRLMELARLQLLAGLEKLRGEQRVEEREGKWALST
jgi:endoribonuclease LACTB2